MPVLAAGSHGLQATQATLQKNTERLTEGQLPEYPLSRGFWLRLMPALAAGSHGLQAAWATLQENAERVVVKVLAGQAGSIWSQARAAAWLPELPPRANAAPSPYVSEIIEYMGVRTHPHFCQNWIRLMPRRVLFWL